MNDFFDEIEKVESRQREFEEGGKTFIIEASDPYGFWSAYEVNGNRKTLVPGQFTTQAEAKLGVKRHLSTPKTSASGIKKEKN